MKFKYGKRKQLSIFPFDGIHFNCAKNKHLCSGSSLRGSRLNFPQCIFLDRIFLCHSNFDQWTTVWGMPGEQRAHSGSSLQVSPYCENRPHVRSASETTGRPQHWGLLSFFIHSIKITFFSCSFCAVSNGFLFLLQLFVVECRLAANVRCSTFHPTLAPGLPAGPRGPRCPISPWEEEQQVFRDNKIT